jgi:uncharacterized membrane protein (DUF2068 family)
LIVTATSLLIPLELYELVRTPSLLKAAGITVNLAIVAYLARRLRERVRETVNNLGLDLRQRLSYGHDHSVLGTTS